MQIQEVQAKSVLVRCGIPGIDFTINPYTGCGFACKYCYASFMGRFVNKSIQEWGTYVYPKVNAEQVLKREVSKLKNKGRGKEIFISSVTDPYQGLEARYKLTRRCLEVLADHGFEGMVSILTKSDLVTRDIDVFKRLKHVLVGITVTSTDDGISRYFETYAPAVSQRFKALQKLHEQGISTYAFIGPLLPHFVAQPEKIDTLFKHLKEVGTTDVFVETLNLSTYIKNRLFQEMKDAQPQIQNQFYSSQSKTYRNKLNDMVQALAGKNGINLLTDMVIFHKDYQSKPKGVGRIDEIIAHVNR